MPRISGWVPSTGLYATALPKGTNFQNPRPPTTILLPPGGSSKSVVFYMYLASIGDCFVRLKWKQLDSHEALETRNCAPSTEIKDDLLCGLTPAGGMPRSPRAILLPPVRDPKNSLSLDLNKRMLPSVRGINTDLDIATACAC